MLILIRSAIKCCCKNSFAATSLILEIRKQLPPRNLLGYVLYEQRRQGVHSHYLFSTCNVNRYDKWSKTEERIVDQDVNIYKTIYNSLEQHIPGKYSLAQIHGVCDAFISMGASRSNVQERLCQMHHDSILSVPLSKLTMLLEVLRSYGIGGNEAVQVCIALGDSMGHHTAQSMHTQLQELRNMQILEYLPMAPFILLLQCSYLEELLQNLRSLFPPKELNHLIKNSPNVLLDPWATTQKKIFYIHDEMGLDQPHMAYNKSLSWPLHHIMNRHQILLRLGRYSKPKIFRDRLSYLINPKLEHIMDSTDRQFCARVACVSLEEWLVFQELMQQERRESPDGVPLDLYDEDDEIEEEEQLNKFAFSEYPEKELKRIRKLERPRWKDEE